MSKQKRGKLQKMLLLVAASFQLGLLSSSHKINRRRWRIRLVNKCRKTAGRFLSIFNVMMQRDPEEFYKYTRLYVHEFDQLASLVEKNLTRRSCISSITVKERLAITLVTYPKAHKCVVARAYLRGRSTVCRIIRETCDALWNVLSPIYLKPPTPETWEEIKSQFWGRWNVPNCLGSIDGKPIAIQSPYKSGTRFYNYKHFYSIVLMAICDADYRFIFVDIGAQGICGDSSVFRNSTFGKAILNETIDAPREAVLPGSEKRFPCFFVAGEAFPLRKNMRPFPRKNATKKQLVFNYRISRGRRVIENSFGILASRWRILRKHIIAHPKTVDSIVKATVVLHNFLRTCRKNDSFVTSVVDVENQTGQITLGGWRFESNGFENLKPQSSRNYSAHVMENRFELRNYFNSEVGRVAWQDDMV